MSDTTESPLRETDLDDVGVPLPGAAWADPLLGLLPATYAAVLRRANGFTINHGMNRIFGLRADRHMDLRAWNEESAWRFAWGARADERFLFFGETAFGDQYALRRGPGGVFEDRVFLLDANLLTVEPVADSFDVFLRQEIIDNARQPHDPLAVEAIEQFGRVAPSDNLVLTPSLLVGGEEEVANMMPLDSFTAMIYGGDVCTAVMAEPDETPVSAVQPWTDELGRQRLKVLFA